MAHELTIRENGFVEMAYLEGVGRWHGLGNELKKGAPIEEWKIAAGMDWRAMKAQVRYAIAKGSDPSSYRTFGEVVDGKYEGHVVLFRDDNKNPLGLVSSRYNVVQPGQCLDFWNGLVDAGGMTLQTAGTMFGGAKFWALATVGEAAIIDPKNIVRRNLLIATSIDGSMATTAFYCDETVVCHNTLQAAFSEGTPKIKINHRTKFNADKVKEELGIASAVSNFKTTLESMRKLAEKRILASDAVLLACELANPGYLNCDDTKEQRRIENSKPVTEICTRFLDQKAIGMEFDGMKGTAWGFLNSVTEYVDHAARAKSADTRMDSAFFGKGAATKMRAYELVGAYEPTPTGATDSVNDWIARHGGGKAAGSDSGGGDDIL